MARRQSSKQPPLKCRAAVHSFSPDFYRNVLGFRVAEQDPAPADALRPERGQLGLVHIAFKVDSYAALRDAYAHLLAIGVEIQRAVDHVCQRSLYFTDPDDNGLEIYYEMPNALTMFPNGRGDEDERLPLSRPAEPLPAWLLEDWPGRFREGRTPAPTGTSRSRVTV